jgi:ribosomal protein S18 acetylase RimI-like enzyme
MIEVREAHLSDQNVIAAFQLEMAKETEGIELDKVIVSHGVLAVFNDSAKGAYYVAEDDGEVVGSLLTTYEWSDWRNGQVIWIQSVFVKKEHRNKGIYKRMYAYIKARVTCEGSPYRGIRLYVDKTNSAAIQVYQNLGMDNHHYETFEWMKP